MALCGKDLNHEKDMYKPIIKSLSRDRTIGKVVLNPFIKGADIKTFDIPDVVYFAGHNRIHIVEAKRYIRNTEEGIDQLRRYKGNFKYLALPIGEYNQDVEYVKTFLNGVFGLILVSKCGVGYTADLKIKSKRSSETDFGQYYKDFSQYYKTVINL